MLSLILKGNSLYDDFINYLKDNNIKDIFIVSFHYKEEPKLIKILKENNIKITIFNKYTSNPKYEEVLDGLKEFKKTNSKFILAIGGGSPMDIAKCIKGYASMPNNTDYINEKITDNDIILAVSPTTAGTGSERTKYAVIYKDGVKQSITSPFIIPNIVLLEPQFLKELPIYYKKVTMLDTLSHSIESYWSINSNDESKKYSEKAINLLLDNMDKYLKEDENVYENMLLSSLNAGEAINITQTTAGHALSYKLTSLYKIPHGLSTALINSILIPYMYDNAGKDLKDTLNNLSKILRLEKEEDIKYYLDNLLKRLKLYDNLQFNYNDIDELVNSVNIER